MRDLKIYVKWAVKKWQNPGLKLQLYSVLFILTLFAIFSFLIYNIGDPDLVFIHGFHIPVIIAAIIFRTRGGIIAAFLAGFILAPFIPFASMEIGLWVLPDIFIWGIRAAMFMFVGVITGVTFDFVHYQLEELEQSSFYNPGTKLPNRYKLIDEIEWLVDSTELNSFSIIMIDIGNYTDIINNIGHQQKNKFLKKIYSDLKIFFNNDIQIYNVYDNKFALFLKNTSTEKLYNILEKLLEKLEEPFDCIDIPVYLDSYIGIANYPESTSDEIKVIENAYIAMKKARKNSMEYCFYDVTSDKNEKENLYILGEVKNAIQKNDFILYYQPKLDLKQRKITGAEALIRWQHQKKGLMLPGKFIPQVEKTALINKLSYWVIERAVKDLIEFKNNDININIAVNLAPRNLLDDSFITDVVKLLKKYNHNYENIEFELTERDIMKELTREKNILNNLSDLGFKISMDDFGTGYSSLAYLKNLKINNIKIDRSFVRDILTDNKDREIIKTAIDLGHILDKNVIAEGVECEEALKMINQFNCDYAQGYYISKPLTFSDFQEFYINY